MSTPAIGRGIGAHLKKISNGKLGRCRKWLIGSGEWLFYVGVALSVLICAFAGKEASGDDLPLVSAAPASPAPAITVAANKPPSYEPVEDEAVLSCIEESNGEKRGSR